MERLADLFLARSEPNRWITVRIVVDPPVLVLSDCGETQTMIEDYINNNKDSEIDIGNNN